MAVELNHTIVWCSDQKKSAGFLAHILGLPAPRRFYHFLVVDLDNAVSMDYYQTTEPITVAHYAFLVPEADFDSMLTRVKERGGDIWADPARTQKGEINRNDGGRGFYFLDPDGHVLELITKPYGDPTT